jgi:dephospho-CoA kinase
MEDSFDAVVAVAAPDEVRSQRLEQRGVGLAAEESGRQLSQDEKSARAHHVIVNDGTIADLDARVATLIDELTGAGG